MQKSYSTKHKDFRNRPLSYTVALIHNDNNNPFLVPAAPGH